MEGSCICAPPPFEISFYIYNSKLVIYYKFNANSDKKNKDKNPDPDPSILQKTYAYE